MKHLVCWSPEADERLQSLIEEGLDQGQAARILREIDYWLARGPLEFGKSRFENVRLGVIAPFAVACAALLRKACDLAVADRAQKREHRRG